MNRQSQRGIALVITLIMLSVVTFMTVIFLAMSRRERASVKISEDQNTARLMADAANARVQAQVIARMMSAHNRLAYDLFVSTNYINPLGFTSQGGNRNSIITNVNYFVGANGAALSKTDYQQNIANLQIDPRAPVFVTTNRNMPYSDDRFFLDFNRNGLFEATGRYLDLGKNGLPSGKDTNLYQFVGDPQWVGVLEHPEYPHSETNRFIGRWAFLVLPAGKSLDMNYIHNEVRFVGNMIDGDTRRSYFSRNQGVGSYEINLAGYFRALNTNIWTANEYRGYESPLGTYRPSGKAFEHALGVIGYRYNDRVSSLLPLGASFTGRDTNNFISDQIDTYGDGPIIAYNGPRQILNNDNDPVSRPWPGSDNPNTLVDVQEILIPKGSSNWNSMATDLQRVSKLSLASYDRYTLYRSLGELGVDSAPATKGKIHLNYANYPGQITTNLVPWAQLRDDRTVRLDTNSTPYTNFFLLSSDAMLRASVVTNVVFPWTNWFGFRRQLTNNLFASDPLSIIRPDFALTNIQIYHTAMRTNRDAGLSNEYTAPVHRVLQLSANIYDNMTNRGGNYPYLPSIFRPVFAATATNVYITGWLEETNARFVTNSWRYAQSLILGDPSLPPRVYPNINVYGQPAVVGAKKGWPNFNEFAVDIQAEVTRKLEFIKAKVDGPVVLTNQMHLLSLQGLFGVEAWNSYSNKFPRPLRWHVALQSQVALFATNNGVRIKVWPLANNYQFNLLSDQTTNSWEGWVGETNLASIKIPLFTNVVMLAGNNALLRSSPYFTTNSTNSFERSFDPPSWNLEMTNYVQYWLVDPANNAVVDFVNLGGLVTKMDIARLLALPVSSSSAGIVPDPKVVTDSMLWVTNRVSSNNLASPTLGVMRQIAISTNLPSVNKTMWMDYSMLIRDKEKAITNFLTFINPRAAVTEQAKLGLRLEAPFNPTRVIVLRASWQANDPLVHYTASDLFNPLGNSVSYFRPTAVPFVNPGLGAVNRRYSPWGGSPQQGGALLNTDYSIFLKDPGITNSDAWFFPINQRAGNSFRFPSIGELGGVHRGTPWQTVYLKADTGDANGRNVDVRASWCNWNNTMGTYPTHDLALIGLFTAAPNENATRGLLSVNQGNLAAWTAVLSGVPVISNSVPNAQLSRTTEPTFITRVIEPASDQVREIVNGINATRSKQQAGVFSRLGDILRTPQLSAAPGIYGGIVANSPYINGSSVNQVRFGLTDEVVESIPRRILGLLKVDEPRFVVYAYGQSLKPAERSITTDINFYNLCTNYQVTGEIVTKTIFRVDGEPDNTNSPLRTVVEDYSVLPPTE